MLLLLQEKVIIWRRARPSLHGWRARHFAAAVATFGGRRASGRSRRTELAHLKGISSESEKETYYARSEVLL